MTARRSGGKFLSIRPKVFLKGLTLILTFAAFGFLLKYSGLASGPSMGWIDANVRGKGVSGEVLFIGMGALFMAVGVPRQFICFLGGYAFGFGVGSLLALLASLVSCAGNFFYARLMGRSFIRSRFERRIKRMDDFLRDNPVSMTLLIRFLPVGSNLITNLVAGVSSVGAVPFLLGSLLGYIPQTVVFALLGSGINVNPTLRVSLSVALFGLSAILGVVLYRNLKRGRGLDDELEATLTEPDDQE